MTPGQAKLKKWRHEPLSFVREQFKVEPDAWQADSLLYLAKKMATPQKKVGDIWELLKLMLGLKACTGPGKSTDLAWIGWWRLACFGMVGEHPKGAALSGEGADNLRDNLWSELSKWQQRSPYLTDKFQWTKERIFSKEHPETWFLSARSYAKDADPEAIGRSMSGLHCAFPFLLLDEIGDAPIALGQKAKQIFTGNPRNALIAAAGNPTSTSGLLYHIFSIERAEWEIVTITADPDDPKRTPRVDIEHAREQIRLYGRDNPWVMATILGQFPSQGFNALLGVEEVEAAIRRHLEPDQFQFAQKRIGVDVARFGDDRTVLFPRQGLRAYMPVEMRNARTNEIAARVATAKARWKSEAEFVDDSGGYGGGVIDSMLQGGLSPIPVNFGGKSIDPRYFNKRSEIWFEMADWVKRGGSLPNVPGLIRELTAPTYTFQQGKLRLEEKDQIKKRLQFSPDLADALALTFAIADQPAAKTDEYGTPLQPTSEKILSDWNPFEERA